MKLILSAPVEALAEAFDTEFNGLPNVVVHRAPFETIPDFDCMVSAANSFGLMDGGVDAAITAYFGEHLMERVQQRIIDEYAGEQPVGSAFVITTNLSAHPYLVHAPTMRVPEIIHGTDATYRATWAALIAIRQHNISNPENIISSVVFPGMGTGCGQVRYRSAAAQMALAWRNFYEPADTISWNTALTKSCEVASAIWI